MTAHSAAAGADFHDGCAFIEGAYVPIADARISVLDFGLTRSDCTYDVVHVWRGRFFRLDRHLDRFLAGTERIHLNVPHGRAELAAILNRCVALAGLEDAFVSMTCTRGRPPAGVRDPRLCRNNFYCYAIPFVWIADEAQLRQGLHMHLSSIPRIAAESVDPTVKNYHWLDLEMSLFEAYEHDAQIVALKDLDGNVTEGPGYNIFALRGGRWTTPERGVLEGITRRTVLDLCAELNVAAEPGRLSEAALREAEEIMVTSTAGGIIPVTRLCGAAVGDGSVGPETARLKQLYWEKHDDPAWTTAVDYAAAP